MPIIPTPRRSTRARVLAGLAALAPLVLIESACARNPAPATQPAPGEPAPPGRLVDIGGYRLHLHCAGSGEPTVVLLAGSGDFSFDWSLVQPELSRSSRVCSYDRAGAAWSDLGPTPRTMRQDVHELHLLLDRAGIRPPYVLVGHSYGGLLARLYAVAFPREVAGMVLVDPTHEGTQLMTPDGVVRIRETARGRAVPPVQTLRSSPPAPPTAADLEQQQLNRQVFGPPAITPPFDRLPQDAQALRLWALDHPKLSAAGEDFWAEELDAIHQARRSDPHPLGSMPLVVLAAGRPDPRPQGMDEDAWTRLVEEKRAQRRDLATLSARGELVVAENAGHHIHLEEPGIVIQAVERVLAAIPGR